MKVFNIFRKKSQSNSVQEHLEALLDPVKPLELTDYPKQAGRPKVLTDVQIIQIMRWKAANVSNCEIARRLRVSESTVRRCLKSLQAPAKPAE